MLRMYWDYAYRYDLTGARGYLREYNYDGNSKKGTRANNKNENETIGKGEVFREKVHGREELVWVWDEMR